MCRIAGFLFKLCLCPAPATRAGHHSQAWELPTACFYNRVFLHKLGIRVLCMLRSSVCACCTLNNRNNAPATPEAMTEDKKQQTGTLLKRPSHYVGWTRPKCCCTKCCCSECCFTGKPETGKPENRKKCCCTIPCWFPCCFRAGFRAVLVYG